MENWVQQYDLLCVEKLRIGLIGTIFYAGVITFVIVIPWLADSYGRRYPYIASMVVFLLLTIGIYLADDLTTLYVLLFFLGGTFGGRTIVAINYLLEFFDNRLRDIIIVVRMGLGSLLIIIFTIGLQFGSRDYHVMGWTLYGLAVAAALVIFILVPESPQYLEERGEGTDYDQARTNLTYVARFNGVNQVRGQPYDRFRFVREAKKNPEMRVADFADKSSSGYSKESLDSKMEQDRADADR